MHIGDVTISHADRIVDDASGLTKGDVARYVAEVAPRMLPYATGRPLALLRCPGGAGAACFFQKRRTPGMPSSIRAARAGGHDVIFVTEQAGLVALAQFGAIELHGWGARLPRPERPDWIVIDLDPDEGLAFARVVEAAVAARAALRSLGLRSFVKTTGGKGLHVVAPIVPELPFADVKRLSHAIALKLTRDAPDAYTAVLSKAARKGKIFVDYLRNGEGATAILPYSARARPGVPVALPVRWADLPHIHPADLTVATVPALLVRRRDPWAGFFACAGRLPDTFRAK